MRRLAETYADLNCATAVAQIPWGHNVALLERLSDNNQRIWYAQQTIESGWSRSMLCMCIKSDLYNRQGLRSRASGNITPRDLINHTTSPKTK